MEKNKLENILKEYNIRKTDNRIAILNCLADEKHFHTVAEIVEHLKTINTKSVYNNIKVLINAGIVDTYSFGGISKYAINDHFKDKHNVAHIVNEAGDVSHVNIPSDIVKKIKNEAVKAGLEPSSVNIFINIKK